MDASKLGNWLQVSANIGIVLGLVMVGVQLKQNSDLTRIQLLYEESRRTVDLESTIVGERGAEVWAKSIEDPENLTLADVRIMEALLWSFVENLSAARIGSPSSACSRRKTGVCEWRAR